MQSWEDIAPDVDRIARGATSVLTAEPVVMLEPTGGSSGGTKLIPYTRTLQRQIREAVAVWMSDLFGSVPCLRDGPAYWSISPALGANKRTAGDIPIGFEDDGAYLSPLHRALSSAVMAVPSAVRTLSDINDFRYATLRYLVERGDLALVSVWNPTFLSLLVNRLRPWGERLAADLGNGTLSLDATGASAQFMRPRPNRGAAARLRRALALQSDHLMLEALWPKLALISAWADAMAADPARDLASLFPRAQIQAKGLIATEGFVSIPLTGHDGAALALTSHLIELAPVAGGPIVFAHDAKIGESYAVILTTGGGLVRYRLGDVVEVVGVMGSCPLVRFVGREGATSDLVGEKLDERFVAQALDEFHLDNQFRLLAPISGKPPAYALFTETEVTAQSLASAAAQLDSLLGRNVHYAYAQRLGQLGALRVFRITKNGRSAYLDGCVSLGQRLGDIKPPALHRDTGWAGRFAGEWIPENDEC